jgi:hypothetical protein
VRLHPETVKALCHNAKSRYGGGAATTAAEETTSLGVMNGTPPTSSTDWTITASVIDPDSWRSPEDMVDFLPLQLTWWWDDGTNTVRFASYNGGRLDGGRLDDNGKQNGMAMILLAKCFALLYGFFGIGSRPMTNQENICVLLNQPCRGNINCCLPTEATRDL